MKYLLIVMLCINISCKREDDHIREAENTDNMRNISRGTIDIWHDDVRGVTCYNEGRGLYCIPDSLLTVKQENK